MPSAQRAYVVPARYRWIGLIVLGVIVVGLLISWPFLRPTSTPQDLATDACQSAVLAHTGDRGTTEFENVATSNITESLLFLGLEQVTDVAVNGFAVHKEGAEDVTQRFVCRVHVEKGETTITDITVD